THFDRRISGRRMSGSTCIDQWACGDLVQGRRDIIVCPMVIELDLRFSRQLAAIDRARKPVDRERTHAAARPGKHPVSINSFDQTVVNFSSRQAHRATEAAAAGSILEISIYGNYTI